MKVDSSNKKVKVKRKRSNDDNGADDMIPDAMQLQPLPLLQECQPCSYLLEEMWTSGIYECLYKPKVVINEDETTTTTTSIDQLNTDTDMIRNEGHDIITDSNIQQSSDMAISSHTNNTSSSSNIVTSSENTITIVADDDDSRVSRIGFPVWSDEYFIDHPSFKDPFGDSDAFDNLDTESSLNDNEDIEKSATVTQDQLTAETIQLDSFESTSYHKVSLNNIVTGERKNRSKKDKIVTLGEICQYLLGNGNNKHVLIKPRTYGIKDNVGNENWGNQPFEIKVHPQVGLLCDIHSHICDAEVIGLLAGKWDSDAKILYVQAVFPCTTTNRTDDGSTDVEMDPIAEFKVRETISTLGFQVIGWFHSHPRFCANPSVTDIENQSTYQNYMNDIPFIGLIVSTYDENLPTPSARHQWFHIQKYYVEGTQKNSRVTTQSRRSVNMPIKLDVTVRRLHKEISLNISSEIAAIVKQDILNMKPIGPDDNNDTIEFIEPKEKKPRKQNPDMKQKRDVSSTKSKKARKLTAQEKEIRDNNASQFPHLSKKLALKLYHDGSQVIFTGGGDTSMHKTKIALINQTGTVIGEENAGWYSIRIQDHVIKVFYIIIL